MIITSIELRNVKSYEASGTIKFEVGVNTISGPNGAGKSTILEAIGLALFDVKTHNLDHFRREGAKRGEIIVRFIDSLDEREYHVEQPLGSGTPSIYDPLTKRHLVSGKTDVKDWLKEHLKVSPGVDLQALFEDAIGVPQGMLVTPFLMTPRERKDKFDPLLQVDDYERVWNNLKDVARYLENVLSGQREELAGLRGELKLMPDYEAGAAQLEMQIEQGTKQLAEVSVQLQQVNLQCETLDELQKQITTLEQRLIYLNSQVEGLVREYESAQAAARDSETAQDIVNHAEAGYQAYQSAQTNLHDLDEQRSARDMLKERLAVAERELAVNRQQVELLEKNLVELQQAEAQMLILEPQVREQEGLANELKIAEQKQRDLQQIQLRVAEEQEKLDRLNAELERVREKLKLLQHLDIERTKLTADQQRLEKQVVQLKAAALQFQQQYQQLSERQTLLGQVEMAECPVCRQPLDEHQRSELVTHYQDELVQLEAGQKDSQAQTTQVEKDIQVIQQALAENQEKVRSLPHASRQEEILKEIELQEQNLKEWQQRQTDLSDVPQQARQLQAALLELGDPLNKYLVVKARVSERGAIEANLAAGRGNLVRIQGEAGQVSQALEAFAGLEDRLKTQQKTLQTYQADYDRYMSNILVAQDLTKRRLKAEDACILVDNLHREEEQMSADLQRLSSGYDAAQHRALKNSQQELSRNQAALEERLSSQRGQAARLKDQIQMLISKQQQLEMLESEHAFSQEQAEALKFIRDTLREVKPYITRQLVQLISLEADRIFGDIMNDYASRLSWSEDYGIIIEQSGNQREFDQLSGGEKMTAALAVRLALLREMSDIGVAFFDEPTANLDEDRRDNLAAQITQIKGFNQLFVISHDDSFERDTHHVIHVTKENGVSQVEVG